MANPILQQLTRSQGQNNVMMQAIGAFLRGESPQAFLQNLAKTNPQLQGLDLTNLDKTAQELCSKNGEDYNAAKNNIMEKVSQFIAK